MFKTINGAVWDAITYARGLKGNRISEYGGWIYRTPEGCYTYKEPNHSNSSTGPDSFPLPTPSPEDVEWWHIHPDRGNSENFSRENWNGNGASGDEGVSRAYQRPGNLGTPLGVVKKIIPSKIPGGPSKIITIPESAREKCGCPK